MLQNLFLNLILKLYLFKAERTLEVVKITKNPFYTLNIDSKTSQVYCKNIV